MNFHDNLVSGHARLPRDKFHHKLVESDLTLEVRDRLDMMDFLTHMDRLDPCGKLFKQNAEQDAGMQCAHAGVQAAAECDMRVGLAVEAQLVGRIEHRGIPVGRSPAKGNPPVRFDPRAMHVRAVRADAPEVGDR